MRIMEPFLVFINILVFISSCWCSEFSLSQLNGFYENECKKTVLSICQPPCDKYVKIYPGKEDFDITHIIIDYKGPYQENLQLEFRYLNWLRKISFKDYNSVIIDKCSTCSRKHWQGNDRRDQLNITFADDFWSYKDELVISPIMDRIATIINGRTIITETLPTYYYKCFKESRKYYEDDQVLMLVDLTPRYTIFRIYSYKPFGQIIGTLKASEEEIKFSCTKTKVDLVTINERTGENCTPAVVWSKIHYVEGQIFSCVWIFANPLPNHKDWNWENVLFKFNPYRTLRKLSDAIKKFYVPRLLSPLPTPTTQISKEPNELTSEYSLQNKNELDNPSKTKDTSYDDNEKCSNTILGLTETQHLIIWTIVLILFLIEFLRPNGILSQITKSKKPVKKRNVKDEKEKNHSDSNVPLLNR